MGTIPGWDDDNPHRIVCVLKSGGSFIEFPQSWPVDCQRRPARGDFCESAELQSRRLHRLALWVTIYVTACQNLFYKRIVDAAAKLVGVGLAPRPANLDIAEHAAWTSVCNILLNLDEAIMRE